MPSARTSDHSASASARPGRAHALELIVGEADEGAVRGRWTVLESAGVPSAARHTGATHRPHVTLVSGPRPPEDLLRVAAERVAPLLPLGLPVVGLGLLGRPGRPTLVDLVCAPAELMVARHEIAAAWPGADERPWLPHLTLAQRLAPQAVAAALAAMSALPVGGNTPGQFCRAVALRWWDPDAGSATVLARVGEHGAPPASGR